MKSATGATLAFALTACCFAKPPADLAQRIDAFAKGETGGVAAAWIDADGVSFVTAGTYGGEDARPITADTTFEIGSISKVFTSLLLARSEEAGKAVRSDPAAKYLLAADDPDQAKLAKITLLSLATHTAGLPRLPVNLGPNPDANPDPYAAYNRDDLVAALREHGAVADVRGRVAYSNFGVAVLGEALAGAWHRSYAEALNAQVLAPLGLNATTVGLTGAPESASLAPAHVAGRQVPVWTFQAFAPAGALRSSARDLSRLVGAYLGLVDTPLRAAIKVTLEPQYPAEDLGGHIGLAWILADADPNNRIAWHNGATAGSHSFVGFNLNRRTGFVLLANFQKPPEAMALSLLGASSPQPAIVAVKNAAGYVGRYPLTPSFHIDVREERGALVIQGSGQPPLPLRPGGEDRFEVVGVPAEISFRRDAAGNVTELVLHQNGRDQSGPRRPLPAPPKEIVLSVPTLREYAGQYPLAPTFVLSVSEENGALFVQATGQQRWPVFARAKDEFFYKVVDAQIQFRRGPGGRVNGLVLHQGGRDMPAPKAGN